MGSVGQKQKKEVSSGRRDRCLDNGGKLPGTSCQITVPISSGVTISNSGLKSGNSIRPEPGAISDSPGPSGRASRNSPEASFGLIVITVGIGVLVGKGSPSAVFRMLPLMLLTA